ncbi:MAG: CpsD/CapB family tyrosine-protein kinase, partial [Clostridia bacterium]|nr:CpsD/CapB family tyrosine-protein kinase [Clostridia bacterium]
MSNNKPNAATEEERTANFYITESYKTIRTNLQFALSATEDKKVTIVTSYEPNAGKSITTANVAITMAQTGAHVLLIDGDMRNASQHKIFSVTNTNGLSKLLSGLSKPDDTSFFRNVRANLDLLPAGPTPPNPSELLCSKNMKKLLDALREAYDYIFIDCPPVGVISDAL